MNFQLFALCLLAFAYHAEAQCNVVSITNGTPSPASGTVADGGTFSVTCASGYAASPASTTCSGTSFAATLTCTAITCAVTSITNGVDTTAVTAYNGAHTFTCNAGYMISGTAALTCDGTQSDNWSAALPTCVVATCAAEASLTQGTFPTKPGTGYTGTVSITCNDGYVLASGADSSSLCTSANTWNPTSLECVVACNAAPTLTQGTFPTKPTGGYGGLVSITCNAGYISASGAATSATCSATNTWTPTSLACTAATCAAVPTLTQGTFPTKPTAGYTGTVTITCTSGYKAGATNSSLCTSTDTWDPTTVTCTAITCSALTVTNGAVTPAGAVANNGVVTVSCNTGYTLSSTTGDLKCDGTLANNYNVTTPTCTASTTVATTAGSAGLFHLHTALMAMLLSAIAFVKAL